MSVDNTFITKISGFLVGTFQVITCVLFGFMFNAGFYMAAYQSYKYLRYGAWPEMSLMYLAPYGPSGFTSWLNAPESWIGLHELIYAALSTMPLSLSLIIVGGLVMLLVRIEGSSCFGAMGGGK